MLLGISIVQAYGLLPCYCYERTAQLLTMSKGRTFNAINLTCHIMAKICHVCLEGSIYAGMFQIPLCKFCAAK